MIEIFFIFFPPIFACDVSAIVLSLSIEQPFYYVRLLWVLRPSHASAKWRLWNILLRIPFSHMSAENNKLERDRKKGR